MILYPSEIDLAEMVLELSEGFRKPMAVNRQHFRIELSPADGDFTVSGDRNQVEVIFHNLISNAVKYGEPDSTLEITLYQKEKTGILVSNAISRLIENPGKLKGQFLRDTFHKDGFGLGLWISDTLSRKNNAELILEAEKGRFLARVEFGKK